MPPSGHGWRGGGCGQKHSQPGTLHELLLSNWRHSAAGGVKDS